MPLIFPENESADFQGLQDAILRYLAQDDSDEPVFQPLTTIYDEFPARLTLITSVPEYERGYEDKDKLRAALDQLVADGMLERRLEESNHETSYRITQDGIYEATIGAENLVTVDGTKKFASTDSLSWTGSKLTYVDLAVLSKIRETARQLQIATRMANFKSQSDKEDIQGLCDALLGLCEMAEPEVDLIDKITSHPKFKHYAAFFVLLATIRGALGL